MSTDKPREVLTPEELSALLEVVGACVVETMLEPENPIGGSVKIGQQETGIENTRCDPVILCPGEVAVEPGEDLLSRIALHAEPSGGAPVASLGLYRG